MDALRIEPPGARWAAVAAGAAIQVGVRGRGPLPQCILKAAILQLENSGAATYATRHMPAWLLRTLRRYSADARTGGLARLLVMRTTARALRAAALPPQPLPRPPPADHPRLHLWHADTLSKWLQEWVAVPQVVVMQGSEPPTALSWLRRRGPPLPEAALHKLFRQEAVRLYSPADQRVTRVSKGRALTPGTMLLLPKAAVAADEQWGSTQQHLATEGEPAARRGLPPAQEQARGEWVARLQASLLHHDSELIALNKPAGLACQGGSGVAFSLDTLMADAFGSLPGTRADQLRLVHRLDRQTTGGVGGHFAPLLELGSSTAQALQWVGARACLHAAISSQLLVCVVIATLPATLWAIPPLPPPPPPLQARF